MNDLVARLRNADPSFGLEGCDPLYDARQEAANEIERLRERVRLLEELYAEEVRSWGTLGGHLTMSENNG